MHGKLHSQSRVHSTVHCVNNDLSEQIMDNLLTSWSRFCYCHHWIYLFESPKVYEFDRISWPFSLVDPFIVWQKAFICGLLIEMRTWVFVKCMHSGGAVMEVVLQSIIWKYRICIWVQRSRWRDTLTLWPILLANMLELIGENVSIKLHNDNFPTVST